MSKAEQNHQTQFRPKHRKTSSDLRRCLKAVSDVDEVIPDDRLFHTRTAATRNARSPMVEWCIGSTTSVDVDADLRCHRETMSATLWSSCRVITAWCVRQFCDCFALLLASCT